MGREALQIMESPSSLDIAASRTDDKVFLHIVNTNVHHGEQVEFSVAGARVQKATAYVVAPDSLSVAVTAVEPDIFTPQEVVLGHGATIRWECPKGAVAAVALEIESI